MLEASTTAEYCQWPVWLLYVPRSIVGRRLLRQQSCFMNHGHRYTGIATLLAVPYALGAGMLVLSPSTIVEIPCFCVPVTFCTYVCVRSSLHSCKAGPGSWYTGMRYCDRYSWLSLGVLHAQTWPNRQFRVNCAKLVQNRP